MEHCKYAKAKNPHLSKRRYFQSRRETIAVGCTRSAYVGDAGGCPGVELMAKLEVPVVRGLRMKETLAVCLGIELMAELHVPVARGLRMKEMLAVRAVIERAAELVAYFEEFSTSGALRLR